MTFYAAWIINVYTITFNSNGGAAIEPIIINWGTEWNELPTPIRTGYDFTGWYLGGEPFTGAIIESDITLTAHWSIKIYTVTFMSGGSVYATLQVPHGTSLSAAVSAAGMSLYNNLFDADGAVLSHGAFIDGDLTVSVVEMTGFERFLAWWRNYWWFPLVCLGVVLLLVIVVKVVKKIRG
jgi:uncharacterized repeat protein (TIGR02543 family)